MDTFVDRKKDVKFSPRFKSKKNNIKQSKLTVMLLTTADLLMKISHAHSFSELLCLLYFHSVGDGLKKRAKKRVSETFSVLWFVFFYGWNFSKLKIEVKTKEKWTIDCVCGEFSLKNVHVPTTQTRKKFFLPNPYESLD